MASETHYASVVGVYETAWCYKEDGDFQKWMLDQVSSLLPASCSSLVDIGCGTGAFSAALAKVASLPVAGVEPSAEMAAKASERGLEVDVTDAIAWSASVEKPFDFMLLKEVRHHIDDPTYLYSNLARKLPPGGKVVLVTRPDDAEGYPFPGHEKWAAGNLVKLPEHVQALADAGLTATVEERPYPVCMPKAEWERLVRAQFWSFLHELSPEDIDAGLRDLALPDSVEFNDRITFVVGCKPAEGHEDTTTYTSTEDRTDASSDTSTDDAGTAR